jgi:hypothetical protein
MRFLMAGVWRRLAGHLVPVVVILLALAWGAGAAEKKRPDNPHERKNPRACTVCHVTVPAEGSQPRRDGNLRFAGDIIGLCSSCHEGYRHMHPVKIAVAPDMKSPEDLPLDKDGKITCITCHDVMEGHGVARKRRVAGKALCLNCHSDTDILAEVVWYPARLRRGEKGRLEVKVVEFRIPRKKTTLGDSVLLYYYAKNVDTGEITFGTNVLHDDGTNGDRVARDSVYTLTEIASAIPKEKRVVYTAWVLDPAGRRSNTVTLAIQYD